MFNKKMCKSVISVLLAMTLTFPLFSGVSAFGATTDSTFLANQAKAIINYENIQSVLKKLRLDSDLGGVFLDEQGNLNVNIKGDTTKLSGMLRSMVALDSVTYHSVNFTKQYLETLIAKLTPKMLDYGISEIALDEEGNRIIVYIDDMNDLNLKNVQDFLGNSAAIVFEKSQGTVEPTAAVKSMYVINQDVSVGYPAVDAWGNQGIVTAGHISTPIGGSVSIQGPAGVSGFFGTVSQKYFANYGNADAAFIKLDPTSTFTLSNFSGATGNTPYSVSSSDSSIIQNAYINMHGSKTYDELGIIPRGKIVSTSVSESYSGKTFTGLVSATNSSQVGDSGGPIVTDGNIIIGVQSARNDVKKISYFSKNSNIFYALSLSKW